MFPRKRHEFSLLAFVAGRYDSRGKKFQEDYMRISVVGVGAEAGYSRQRFTQEKQEEQDECD
jgi:hypothetical protein